MIDYLICWSFCLVDSLSLFGYPFFNQLFYLVASPSIDYSFYWLFWSVASLSLLLVPIWLLISLLITLFGCFSLHYFFPFLFFLLFKYSPIYLLFFPSIKLPLSICCSSWFGLYWIRLIQFNLIWYSLFWYDLLKLILYDWIWFKFIWINYVRSDLDWIRFV